MQSKILRTHEMEKVLAETDSLPLKQRDEKRLSALHAELDRAEVLLFEYRSRVQLRLRRPQRPGRKKGGEQEYIEEHAELVGELADQIEAMKAAQERQSEDPYGSKV